LAIWNAKRIFPNRNYALCTFWLCFGNSFKTNFDEVSDQHPVNGLRRMGHEATASESRLLQQPGQRPRVVQVKMGDQQQVQLLDVDEVDKGKCVDPVHSLWEKQGICLENFHNFGGENNQK